MSISQEFRNAVEDKNNLLVRIMLKDNMVLDPSMKEFNEMILYAENNIEDLYDEHDGEIFSNNKEDWTKEYMDEQMVNVIINFSKERIELLKKVCRYLYSDRIKKHQNEVVSEEKAKIYITKKQVGTGLAVAGVATTVVGAIVSKPIVIGVGVVTTVAGGILILSEK